MSWHHGPLALFDTETSGIDPHRDRIVTAAIVEVVPGTTVRTSTWLIDHGIEIPDAAARIHGITTEAARAGGVDPAGAIYEIAQHLVRLSRAGVPIVGHNVVYDVTLLWAETVRHCPDMSDPVAALAPIIDTLVLDKWADTYRKGSRKLLDVARHYGLAVDQLAAHGAEYDALLAGRVAWHLGARYPALDIPLPALHTLQVEEKRRQADSFGAYLVKQGKPDDVAREWPVQPSPPGWSPEQLPDREQVSA